MLNKTIDPHFKDPILRTAWRLGWDVYHHDKSSTLPGMSKAQGYRMNCLNVAHHYAWMQGFKLLAADEPRKDVLVFFLALPALRVMSPLERVDMFGEAVASLTAEVMQMDLMAPKMPRGVSVAAKHVWGALNTFEDLYLPAKEAKPLEVVAIQGGRAKPKKPILH